MVTVREAVGEDAGAIAAIDVETWRTTYAGILADRLLLGLNERSRAAAWARTIRREPGDVLVAADGQRVLGFGSCGRQPMPDLKYAGEIFTLYVQPDAQGQGTGRLLLAGLFERMIRCGFGSALVWVLRDNPSRYFYERLGGRLVALREIAMSAGPRVPAAAYGWEDLRAGMRQRNRTTSRID
jgi:ribosomal protein S18 acetylase RimI-like enzyme